MSGGIAVAYLYMDTLCALSHTVCMYFVYIVIVNGIVFVVSSRIKETVRSLQEQVDSLTQRVQRYCKNWYSTQ